MESHVIIPSKELLSFDFNFMNDGALPLPFTGRTVLTLGMVAMGTNNFYRNR